MNMVTLPSGDHVPALGQGTWHMGDNPARHAEEIASLRLGIELGMTVIDTAEMYGSGRSELLVGEAIEGRRGEVFLVSKVLPGHATRRGTVAACAASLRRLRTDQLDLYLLHWRGDVPLEETLAGFDDLVRAGAIRLWGVSNFDVQDLEELVGIAGGEVVQTDQVLYNLTRRGIEYDLMPWCRGAGIPMMAYSPVEQGRLLSDPTLRRVAGQHGVTPAQLALAWVLRQGDVIAIPKAATPVHVRENREAAEVTLTEEEVGLLDEAYPPPREARPLEMI